SCRAAGPAPGPPAAATATAHCSPAPTAVSAAPRRRSSPRAPGWGRTRRSPLGPHRPCRTRRRSCPTWDATESLAWVPPIVRPRAVHTRTSVPGVETVTGAGSIALISQFHARRHETPRHPSTALSVGVDGVEHTGQERPGALLLGVADHLVRRSLLADHSAVPEQPRGGDLASDLSPVGDHETRP